MLFSLKRCPTLRAEQGECTEPKLCDTKVDGERLCGAPVREFASSYKVSTGDDEAIFRTYIRARDAFQNKQKHRYDMLNLRARVGSRAERVTKKRDRHPLWSVFSIVFGAYRECGILPGEKMIRAVSTISAISTNNIPSGKQVRECGARIVYLT